MNIKRSKSVFSIILLYIFIFNLAVVVFATAQPTKLVILGDSIAYGMSSEDGKQYSQLLFNHLKKMPGNAMLTVSNYAKPGMDTTDLLLKLQGSEEILSSLGDSRFISLCVGGNNLLKYVIEANNSGQGIASLTNPQLIANLTNGVAKFQREFSQIIQIIMAKAPKAKLFVVNSYNPAIEDDLLGAYFDYYIQQINTIISQTSTSYYIVDAYTAFKTAKDQKPVIFSYLGGQLDPHPTNKGHEIIYLEHLNAKSTIQPDFSDIGDHWGKNVIENMYQSGVVGGYPDKTMRPNNLITRAEAVTMLIKTMEGTESKAITTVTDVADIPGWAFGYIVSAMESGIIKEYGDGSIKPLSLLTRGEIVVMSMNALDDQIPDWARGQLIKALELGIINGYSDNSVRLSQKATRAEALTLFQKVIFHSILRQQSSYSSLVTTQFLPLRFPVYKN